MTKIAREAPEVTAEQALAESVRTFNHREIVRGFSPAQHVLGCAPDETGRFIRSLTGTPWEPLLENPDGEFQRATELRRIAERSLVDWQAAERVKRALNSRSQRRLIFHPGDLVYFWRKQTGQGSPAGKNGMFLGPARILATETRRQPDGSLRPGSAVWCVRGRRLIKCSPEQLRPATGREELVEHLYQGSADATPWTLPRVASEPTSSMTSAGTSLMRRPGEQLRPRAQLHPGDATSPRGPWRRHAMARHATRQPERVPPVGQLRRLQNRVRQVGGRRFLETSSPRRRRHTSGTMRGQALRSPLTCRTAGEVRSRWCTISRPSWWAA